MLDYKDIITKHYALGMSGMAIAKSLNASPSGVNDFLRAFKECKTLDSIHFKKNSLTKALCPGILYMVRDC